MDPAVRWLENKFNKQWIKYHVVINQTWKDDNGTHDVVYMMCIPPYDYRPGPFGDGDTIETTRPDAMFELKDDLKMHSLDFCTICGALS